jgi:hypothetical protein
MTGAQRTPRPARNAEKVAQIADVFNLTTVSPDGLEGDDGQPGPVDPPDEGPTTWTPADLTDALNGVDEPPPVILSRTDGLHLLYAGKTHAFIGESESCKTWGACLATAEVLAGNGYVLWIDFEDDPRGLVNRLKALGVTTEVIAARLHYMHPEEALRQGDKYTRAGAEFQRLITATGYTLAVVDGVTEGMTTEGLDPLGTNDAAIWARRLTKPIAATGAAVVVLDHVPKGNGDGQKRYALGSQHKISGLTGAAYIFDVRRPFHRAKSDPVHAEIVIKVSKDRPGHVRAGAVGFDQVKPIAVMELNAHPDGGVTGRLVPPDQVTNTPPAKLLESIASHLHVYDGDTQTKITEALGGKAETVRAALKYMVAEGLVSVTKAGRSHLHSLTPKGLELVPE